MTKIERQQAIERLSKLVVHKAQVSKSGSYCIVPSNSEPNKSYRVELDEHYHTTACECQGGQFDCMHKQAVRLHFCRFILNLRNDKLNPVYQFKRNGITVKARVSQFSKAERIALKRQQRAEQENNQRRARMRDLYDVNMVA